MASASTSWWVRRTLRSSFSSTVRSGSSSGAAIGFKNGPRHGEQIFDVNATLADAGIVGGDVLQQWLVFENASGQATCRACNYPRRASEDWETYGKCRQCAGLPSRKMQKRQAASSPSVPSSSEASLTGATMVEFFDEFKKRVHSKRLTASELQDMLTEIELAFSQME